MIITFGPSYEGMMNIGVTVVRAGPFRRRKAKLEPARFGSYRKPWLVLGRFRLYRANNVICFRRRTKLFFDSPTFFGRRCFK
jgi:hypothetical protein